MKNSLAVCFKPQDRKNGEDLFNEDAVNLSGTSDTESRAFINASGSHRVFLRAESLSSRVIYTDCTCSSGKKGRLCKHVWAALLQLDSTGADFLAEKEELEPGEPKAESEAVLAAKARQAEYQKQMRERVKARNKEKRTLKKSVPTVVASKYPLEIDIALDYFAGNGIDLRETFDLQSLANARKSLARVFHPDKGGSHEEILELNGNHDVLFGYLK